MMVGPRRRWKQSSWRSRPPWKPEIPNDLTRAAATQAAPGAASRVRPEPLKPISDAHGWMSILPLLPSTVTSCPSRSSEVALPVATTAGT
jgi:hypothetical protein